MMSFHKREAGGSKDREGKLPNFVIQTTRKGIDEIFMMERLKGGLWRRGTFQTAYLNILGKAGHTEMVIGGPLFLYNNEFVVRSCKDCSEKSSIEPKK